jgi:DNA-binding winged helix-turn-helix (wHTH) protein
MLLQVGPFELDESVFELRQEGKRIPVQPKVLRLLFYLVRHRERTVPKEELLRAIWPAEAVGEGSLTRAVHQARRALNDSPGGEGPICSVRGCGYRFVGQVREHQAASADVAPQSSGTGKIATVDAAFLDRLACARTFDEVTAATTEAMCGTFGTHAGIGGFLDPPLRTTSRLYYGMRLSDCEEYERHWRDRDRLFRRVVRRAVPADNWQVHSAESWRSDPVFTEYARRLSIWHYMAIPVFGSRGRVTGVLNLCRREKDPPFARRDIEIASAFSGFVSTALARVSAPEDRVAESAVPGPRR